MIRLQKIINGCLLLHPTDIAHCPSINTSNKMRMQRGQFQNETIAILQIATSRSGGRHTRDW